MKDLGLGQASIQQVEDYWDSRPCNIRHSKLEIGTREYFDEVEKRKYFVEPHILRFADFTKYQGKKVLEIGCGIGTDAVNFCRNGAIYTGIELSSESLEICRRRLDVYGLVGNLKKLNAEDLNSDMVGGDFDLVYSFGVIHHAPNPNQIIEKAKQVLKIGGELKLMVYARNSWKTAMIEGGFDQPEAQHGCPTAYCFTENEMREMLGKSFEIKSIEQDHIFPYSIEEYKNYEYKLLPWFEKMPKALFRQLEASFGWHMLVKAERID